MSSAVIVGASTGVGRALARALARDGRKLVLVSRDGRDIEATAADVRLRFGVECWPAAEDIARADWDVGGFVHECRNRLGTVDSLVIPAGGAVTDDVAPNASIIASVTDLNFVGPARVAAAFAELMAEQRAGTIVLFSSIAAVAPRARNAAYSAAKAALETYARGLRHALVPFGVEVSIVALGYVDTSQSFGQALKFPVASPEEAADAVARRLRKPRAAGGKWHYPWFWRFITLVLRCLPWFVYRRLKF